MKIANPAKDRLFKQLDNCLRALGGYDIKSLIPLLYVLVAHHEGHAVSTTESSKNIVFPNRYIKNVESSDGFASELLKRIRSAADESCFQGQAAECILYFYNSCNQTINVWYQEIIEYIIKFYTNTSGKFSRVNATPEDLAKLMAGLVVRQNPRKIYDPCAGLCSYILSPELKNTSFTGQEIDAFVELMAEVRANAANKAISIFNEDSTNRWIGNKDFDCLVSELPFGIRTNKIFDNKPILLEDYILNQFIESESLNKAVLLVSVPTLIRNGYNSHLRKTLCDKNYVESVIVLPHGILPGIGTSSAVLILNKNRTSNKVKFVLAKDCIQKAGHKYLLDTKAVFDRIDSEDDKQAAIIEIQNIHKDCLLDPSAYISDGINVHPGQIIVKFTDLASFDPGISINEDSKGRLLKSKDMANSVVSMHYKEIFLKEDCATKNRHVKIFGKGIVFNSTADKFFIKNDEEPLFISRSDLFFRVDERRCIPEYLADCVLKAFSKADHAPHSMLKPKYGYLYLPIYESIDTQRQIIQRIYRQEKNELQKKLERLKTLSGESAGLIHSLGGTFTKISAGLSNLTHLLENETTESLTDNVQFALRQINSTGTDFEYVTPIFEKVNVYDILESYIKAWNNFGYSTFEVLPIHKVIADDTKVEIDRNLFYTLLDCIFINAHQHGFAKTDSDDNKLIIAVEGVFCNDMDFVRIGISNNGKPFPENFTVADFSQRGVVGLNSFQDGIGGDHICKIAHKHNGYISIDNESEWLTFNVLIPVYTTSSKISNEYEYEII